MVATLVCASAFTLGGTTRASAAGRCTDAFDIAQTLVRAYAEADYDTVIEVSRTRRLEANRNAFSPRRLAREWGLTEASLELLRCSGSSKATVVTMNYFTDEPKTFCVQWTINTLLGEVTRERTLYKGSC